MLDVLLDVSIRATLAGLSVGLLLRLLRVRSASLRHAAWSGVLIVMLTMPLLTRIVPTVPLPVPSHLVADVGSIAREEVTSDAPAPERRQVTATSPGQSAGGTTRSRLSDGPTLPPPSTPRARVRDSLVSIYVAGVLFLVVRLVMGYRLSRRLYRSAFVTREVDGAPIAESRAVAAPLTVGILRPRVVLPANWSTWPPEKLRAVVSHERAHVVRRDGLIAFLAEVNRALFWFHPLAWWLPRTLATNAEHACDDAARRVVGAKAYAGVLLEVAAAVSSRRHRVAWQALGVEGSGSLGARIDRLLRARADEGHSRGRTVAAGTACALVLMAAVACRQEPAPLRPDPELEKQFAEEAQNTSEFQAAIAMAVEEVDALERRVDASPTDWGARGRLVTYYRAAKNVPWDRKVAGPRKHALWIIEHHPEHESLTAPPLSPQYDPAGFAQATRLWDRHLQQPDASPFLIYRAAQFFAPFDRARAEALILRGMTVDPNSDALKARMPPRVGGYEWRSQLASLYAAALLGSESYFPTRQYHPERASSPFAQEVRRKLDASTDAQLLSRVGDRIISARTEKGPAEEMRTLGREYLTRALQIDPTSESARAQLARADSRERHDRIWAAVGGTSNVPDDDRLAYLMMKASYAYMRLEAAESWRKNADEARKAHDEAKRAAEDLLALAAHQRESPDYSPAVNTAHHTLGLLALHDGDRGRAVFHMLESVKVPAIESTDGILESMFVAQRLPTYLLKEGERESVIQYYEAAAQISPNQRERLLEDARALREGRMPRNYQVTFARSGGR